MGNIGVIPKLARSCKVNIVMENLAHRHGNVMNEVRMPWILICW
ncbi:hypothetical protein HMPREF3191_01658 [Veillonellaceae bacterium DNF00626]|nr:hypothetical protein HMPREF3191_01658 [Veillonellaceae bacterium DNF00626]